MHRYVRQICFALLLISMPAIAAKTMSVQVRKGQVRSTPSYLSRVVDNLEYTDRVTVLEQKGAWYRVKVPNKSTEGWMHAAALTKKKLKLVSGAEDATTAVSSDEQALAGKGFNSDVEAEFKQQNKDIDFTWVDKMGKIVIPTSTLVRFLKTGDLKPAEGGAE